jgi:hypothetical protein
MPLNPTPPTWYLAVIGDLISSRQISERDEVQQSLRAFLEDCNTRYRAVLHSPFRITLGDEFQGLAGPGFPLEHFVFRLHAALRPRVSARLGLGLGALSTQGGPVVSDLDGPCFHSARDAVNRAREGQRPAGRAIGHRKSRTASGCNRPWPCRRLICGASAWYAGRPGPCCWSWATPLPWPAPGG